MASTFSSALNLELQASGENSGNWGNITNSNLQKVESAVKGFVTVAIASTTDSLVASDGGTTDEQSNAIIRLTGTLTGNTTMQSEAVETWYIVDNVTRFWKLSPNGVSSPKPTVICPAVVGDTLAPPVATSVPKEKLGAPAVVTANSADPVAPKVPALDVVACPILKPTVPALTTKPGSASATPN